MINIDSYNAASPDNRHILNTSNGYQGKHSWCICLYICEVDYITFKVDLLEKYFDGLWKTQCSSQLDAGDPSTCPWKMDGL